jgi:hypothetical protein
MRFTIVFEHLGSQGEKREEGGSFLKCALDMITIPGRACLLPQQVLQLKSTGITDPLDVAGGSNWKPSV